MYQGTAKFEYNSRFDSLHIVELLILIVEITNSIEQISNELKFLLVSLRTLLSKDKFKNYEIFLSIEMENQSITRTIKENGEVNERIEEKTSKITTSEDLTENAIQDIVKIVIDKIF